MKRFFFLLCCWALAVSVASARDDWKSYTNARFGFRLRYPAALQASREPDNGAGQEFHSADEKFSVATSAHFLRTDDGDSLEAQWRDELKTLAGTITYQKKGATWYVVSGVSRDGTEYYHKLYTRKGNWVALHMTYPHAEHRKYDPWVKRIEKSFVPFLPGDYDRLSE